MNNDIFEKEWKFAEKTLMDKSKLEEENEKLQTQIDDYNLLINDILNKINEFKEKMILCNKN